MDYLQIKEEIVRVVESGLLGKAPKEEEESKGGVQKPMEVDPLSWEAEWGDLNYFQKGKGKGYQPYEGGFGQPKGGKGGKGDGKVGPKGGETLHQKEAKKREWEARVRANSPRNSRGYCSYCSEWGHTQRFCPKKEKEWWGGKGIHPLEDEAAAAYQAGAEG